MSGAENIPDSVAKNTCSKYIIDMLFIKKFLIYFTELDKNQKHYSVTFFTTVSLVITHLNPQKYSSLIHDTMKDMFNFSSMIPT